MNKKAGIYVITCLVNNLIYIGSTYNLSKRKQDHFCRLKGNYHENSRLQNAFNKYGKVNFKFEVLEYVTRFDYESKQEFKERLVGVIEQSYLDVFQPYKNSIGFNFSKKALSCYGISTKEETKQKQREAKLKKPTRYWLGKEFPKEATLRALETKKLKGYKVSNETIAKKAEKYRINALNGVEAFKCNDAILISPDGKEINVHNIAKFDRSIGLNPASLQSVASGKVNSCFGWKLKGHIPILKPREPIKCAICASLFIQNSNTAKYCSKECVKMAKDRGRAIKKLSLKQAA